MAGGTAHDAAVHQTKRSTAQRHAARRWAAQSREKLVWRLTARAQAAEQAEKATRMNPEVTRRLQAVAPVLAAAVCGKPVPAGSHLIRNVALHAKHLPQFGSSVRAWNQAQKGPRLDRPQESAAINSAVTQSDSTVAETGKELQVFVKTLSGKTVAYDALISSTVRDVKNGISDQVKVAPANQRLIFAGKQLRDGQKIATYGIQNGSTLHLASTLAGGAGGTQGTQSGSRKQSAQRGHETRWQPVGNQKGDKKDAVGPTAEPPAIRHPRRTPVTGIRVSKHWTLCLEHNRNKKLRRAQRADH